MASGAEVSVIIPVYNDAERLALCLERIAAQTFPLDAVEVLVVDNGSEEPPQPIAAEYSFCRLLHESQPGSYAARNRALTEARGELLVFTDADCLPEPGWLAAGVTAVRGADGPVVVGGAIELFAADRRRPTAAELYDVAFGLQQEAYVKKHHWAATANLFTSRRVIDDVGPFNDNLKSSGDADWGLRAHKAGWPVLYAADAIVRHPARGSLGAILAKSRRHAGGRVAYLAERTDKPSLAKQAQTAIRLIVPQIGHIARGQHRLADRGYGLGDRLKAGAVALLVQYSKLAEMVRTRLGGAAERR